MIKAAYLKTDWFIGLVVTLFVLLAAATGLLRGLEWQAYDLGVRFSSTKPAHQDVVVIAIDDAALQELGAWPWPRDILAQATTVLAAAKPSVIGYALPFDVEQTPKNLYEMQKFNELLQAENTPVNPRFKRLLIQLEERLDTDRIFAQSLSRAGRVVLAMPYLFEAANRRDVTVELPEYLQKYTLRDASAPIQQSAIMRWFKPDPVAVAAKVYPPIEQLARHAGGAGLINLGASGQTTARTLPLVFKYGDNYLPSFTLMMAARNLRLSTRQIQVDLGQTVELAGMSVRADNKLQIYPRFYKGKNGQPAFKVYSILDVLNNNIKRSNIHNKTVLIGLTAKQYITPLKTPIGERMAPVMVSAHAVSSMLNEELFSVPKTQAWIQLAVFVGIGLYLVFVLPRFRLGTGLILSVLLVVILLNIHFYSMISESIWLPLMAPLCALLVGHGLLGIKHFAEAKLGRMHTQLSDANQTLGQYLHLQGQFDEAFEKYRSCFVDTSLLSKLYNLGLDYERKRQFNKAVSVFKYIESHNPAYNDVKERLNRNQEVSAQMLGGGMMASDPANGTMVISSPGVEKPMLGRYKVDRELGRGAMGMVYFGHDPKIGRTVAIKTMSLAQEFEPDKLAEIKQRFFREAETAGRLNHPNIVTIYDVGEEQDLSYIAMDYLKGENLLTYTKTGSLLPAAEVFDIIMVVASALNYAHEQKVVHRDIKPANIIYDRDTNSIKVTDFGVACLTDASKTKTGTILGSPSYMSPEQLAGSKVDGRTDLFSLGVTLYQMLTGELPFVADSLASLMYKIANEKHPDIRMFKPELPSCVSQIINKALHKDIERRFQTGEQMVKAMTRCRERLKTTNNNKKTTAVNSSDK